MQESKGIPCSALDNLVMCMISSRTQQAMCHVITVHVRPCFLVPGKKWRPCHSATLMSASLLVQLQGGEALGIRHQGTRCACMPSEMQ